MRALRLNDSSALVEEDISQPSPGPGEVLVRVHAAGVTATELRWYPTLHAKSGGQRSHAEPGHEFSGVVAASGEGVTGFEAGREVYGMNDWYSEGALAEFCITQPAYIAPKPRNLTHAQAAAVPIGGLTAWQGLFDRARLQRGERVLVHGGAGGVGVFAVQLARFRGAHVIATASARNRDFVSQLGAEQVIDYRAARFDERLREIDVVFDTVGGETLERSWSVLKPGGRMITIVSGAENSADDRVKQAFFIVAPNQAQLGEIGNLIEAGHLRPVVDAVVPFENAAAAYAGQIRQRQGLGKMVVAIVPMRTSTGFQRTSA